MKNKIYKAALMLVFMSGGAIATATPKNFQEVEEKIKKEAEYAVGHIHYHWYEPKHKIDETQVPYVQERMNRIKSLQRDLEEAAIAHGMSDTDVTCLRCEFSRFLQEKAYKDVAFSIKYAPKQFSSHYYKSQTNYDCFPMEIKKYMYICENVAVAGCEYTDKTEDLKKLAVEALKERFTILDQSYADQLKVVEKDTERLQLIDSRREEFRPKIENLIRELETK
jgi:hypothetical protein